MRYDIKLCGYIEGGAFRVMSHNTLRAQRIIKAYDNLACCNTLDDCYKKPSHAKELAYERCIRICQFFNGEYGTILGYNPYKFSYAFVVRRENGTRWIVYLTPSHAYAIPVWVAEEAEYEKYLDERDKVEVEQLFDEIDELLKNKE